MKGENLRSTDLMLKVQEAAWALLRRDKSIRIKKGDANGYREVENAWRPMKRWKELLEDEFRLKHLAVDTDQHEAKWKRLAKNSDPNRVVKAAEDCYSNPLSYCVEMVEKQN